MLKAFAILCVFSSFVFAAEPDSAHKVAVNFYGWVLAHPSAAIPTSKERNKLAKVLSPQIMQLLSAAAKMEAQCTQTSATDEKPLTGY